jgi:hypothetical protein
MPAIVFEGHWAWVLLWILGMGLLYARYLRDRSTKSWKAALPGSLAEACALSLLCFLLLQPVFLRDGFHFSKQEVWVVVDHSQSFDAGTGLGVEKQVDSSISTLEKEITLKGYQVRKWKFADKALEANQNGFLNVQYSSLNALAEAVGIQGNHLNSVVLFADGRENPRPELAGLALHEANFRVPIYPIRFSLGDELDVQVESASWLSSESQVIPYGLNLKWQRWSRQVSGLNSCLLLDSQSVRCWVVKTDTSVMAWGIQSDSLPLSLGQASAVLKAKSLILVTTPMPEGGKKNNDTLVLKRFQSDAKLQLCWPTEIRSLEETAALRLLTSDTLKIHFLAENKPCPEGIRILRWQGVPAAHQVTAKTSQPLLRIVLPDLSPQEPGPPWQYFSTKASLGYSPLGRRVLPPALGALGDISTDGLRLPRSSSLESCALQAIEGQDSGCILGWTRNLDSTQTAQFSLPKIWSQLFREEGDAALSTRVRGLLLGAVSLAGMIVDRDSTSPPMALNETREMSKRGLDVTVLSEVARRSGGDWILPNTRTLKDTVVQSIPWLKSTEKEMGKAETRRLAVGFDWVWFAAVVALLALAWFWRRRYFLG